MTPGDDVDRSVVRRAVLLCSVAVLAGCLGGGSSASPVGPPDAAWTTGDRLDTTALARQHVETLRGAGSFTMNHSESMRVDAAGQNATRLDGYGPPSYTRHRVALADGRYLGTSVTVGHGRSTRFVGPDVTATRRRECPDCAYTYRHRRRPDADARAERIDRYRTDRAVERLDRFLRGARSGSTTRTPGPPRTAGRRSTGTGPSGT